MTRHARERIRGMRIAVSTNTRPDIALTIDLVPRIGQDNRRRRRETARNRGSRYRETSFVCARFDVARYRKIWRNFGRLYSQIIKLKKNQSRKNVLSLIIEKYRREAIVVNEPRGHL